jgi:phage gp29-like protein
MPLFDQFAERVRAAGRAFVAPIAQPKPKRADYNNVEARGSYVEPHVRTQTTWTPDDIRNVGRSADSGDFMRLADLCESILADDRVNGVLNTRANALLGAPLTFEPGRGRARKTSRAVKALEAGEDWWTMLPDTILRQHLTWSWIAGFSYGQLRYSEHADHGGRTLPVLDFWHPRHLRRDIDRREWLTRIGTWGGSETVVVPNGGKWAFLCPFGSDRPWALGLWRGLARLWLLKSYAIDDWARYGDAHGNPLRVASPPAPGEEARNATPGLRKQLSAELAEMAGGAAIVLPPGFDFKQLVEATANTWETFKAQIDLVNAAISIAVLGSNLPTEVSGNAGTGATAQHLVRVDYKRNDASVVSEWAHDAVLVHWAFINFGNRGLAAWPIYDVEPEADKVARVNVAKMFAETIAQQAAPGATSVAAIDFEQLAEDLSLPLKEAEQSPLQAADGAEEQMPIAEAQAEADVAASIVMLAVTPEARQKRIDEAYSKYHDTVNMGAAELERWAETECSKLASLDRSPITRNLRLLRKEKAQWTIEDAADAMRTVSFVSRMKGAEQGNPAREGCPSRRDISLKNWAYNPSRATASVMTLASRGEIAPALAGQVYVDRVADKMTTPPMMVEKAVAAVMKARSYEGARKALLKLASDVDDPAFVDMMTGAMTLAAAAGVWSVEQETQGEE